MGNKTALIVGASRGLGLAIVQEYLARGWDVVGTVRAGSATRDDGGGGRRCGATALPGRSGRLAHAT